MKNIRTRYKKQNIDIKKDRRSKGINHHPKSVALMKHLEYIDYYGFDDYFRLKSGGAGDNRETLMYELDNYFELLDKEQLDY